jgi:hypothetical protein
MVKKSLNDITADDLNEIEKLAAALMVPKQIAAILGIDSSFFLSCLRFEGNDVHHRYFRGSLMQEYELKLATIKMAKAGSTPAQNKADDYLKDQKLGLYE